MPSLKKINIGGSIEEIADSAFFANPLTSVTFPSTLKRLGAGVFKNTKLTGIDLPESVEELGSEAFIGCKIINVTVQSAMPPAIEDDTFGSYTYIYGMLSVPQQSVDSYKAATGWREFSNMEGYPDTGVEVNVGVKKEIIKTYDLNGRIVKEPYTGMVIHEYSDGSFDKQVLK